MIFEVGNLVEVRTTYGSLMGLLIELNQLTRRCKILLRNGGIIESDERYLILYGIGI
jgi:hypothetical protein